MNPLAPIIMFVYNRPDMTQNTLNSLVQNKEAQESDIFIFADGPKVDMPAVKLENLKKVRALLAQQKGFKSITIRTSEVNRGLAYSVIAGVTEVVNQYGKAIIVEDDRTLSPYFLQFMNDALTVYEEDEKVSSIGSWNYFYLPPENAENFFLRHPDVGAWATFKRAWDLFNPDADYLIQEIKRKNMAKAFNMENSIDLMKMLYRQKNGQVDSWAVRWTASVMLQDKLTFYPQRSLSSDDGQTEGTHFKGDELFYGKNLELSQTPIIVRKKTPVETPEAVKAYVRYHKKHHSLLNKIVVRSKKILKNVLTTLQSKSSS